MTEKVDDLLRAVVLKLVGVHRADERRRHVHDTGPRYYRIF